MNPWTPDAATGAFKWMGANPAKGTAHKSISGTPQTVLPNCSRQPAMQACRLAAHAPGCQSVCESIFFWLFAESNSIPGFLFGNEENDLVADLNHSHGTCWEQCKPDGIS